MAKVAKAESQTLLVNSFNELISSPFKGEVNAICWNRQLKGNFAEIANKLELLSNVTVVSKADLSALQLSEQGKLAREILIDDLNSLTETGASPVLNLIEVYHRDDSYPFFPTDVYSFHVDRSPAPTSTFLCTYHGQPSQLLQNNEATQKILIPKIRAELKKLYNGPDDGFDSFLSDYFFDLHYQEKPNAIPIDTGNGNIWKLAVDHPNSNVLPCIHRAPKEKDGEKRLLLIC